MTSSRNFSLKHVTFDLTRLVGALPVIFALVGMVLVVNLMAQEKAAHIASLSNRLADEFLQVSAETAKERGVAAIVLADSNAALEDITLLSEIRSAGDANYRQASRLLDEMIELRGDAPELIMQRDALLEQRRAFEQARARVDEHARGSDVDANRLLPAHWISIATSYVDAQTRVRLASTRAHEGVELATYANLAIKQPIFTAAEYAGRERALVGSHLREGKPLSARTRENLLVYRALVDESVHHILELKSSPVLDESLRNAIGQMERSFLGTWESRRRQILHTGPEEAYPIDAHQWYLEATQGIDSILAVGQAATQSIVEPLRQQEKQSRWWLWFGGLGMLGFVGVAQLGALILSRRVRAQLVTPVEGAFEALSQQATYLKRTSAELGDASQAVADASHDQASAVQETVASMAQMDSVLAQTANHARDSREIARAVTLRSESGRDAMEKMVEAVAAIQLASDQLGKMDGIIENIGGRTAIINDIVFKTQLLSFNASIEAARAGQHGRGFAVVAEEIGNLAQTSGNAAKDIQVMLADSQRQVVEILDITRARVRDGHTVASEAKLIFNQIAQEIQSVSHQVQSIADAAKEQEIGSRQISQAMTKMEEIMHRNNISAQNASLMASQLRGHSDELTTTTRQAQVLVLGSSSSRPEKGEVRNSTGAEQAREHPVIDADVRNERSDPRSIAARIVRSKRGFSDSLPDVAGLDPDSSDFERVA